MRPRTHNEFYILNVIEDISDLDENDISLASMDRIINAIKQEIYLAAQAKAERRMEFEDWRMRKDGFLDREKWLIYLQKEHERELREREARIAKEERKRQNYILAAAKRKATLVAKKAQQAK